MRLDLYLAETRRLASVQADLLSQAAEKLNQSAELSGLEQSGMLHALQILFENAIGKAKHLLKAAGKPVPVSAYDAFKDLVQADILPSEQQVKWNAIIGLRNRIVHEYLNLDISLVEKLVQERQYQFVVDFLNE